MLVATVSEISMESINDSLGYTNEWLWLEVYIASSPSVPVFAFCLLQYACLTVDPWVASLILARSHTFVEIDHKIDSTVILLPSAESFKKGCCQLQANVCARGAG